MNVTLERAGTVSVVEFQGRLDSNTVSKVEGELLGFIEGGATRLVFDLGQLDYISSAGLRAMLIVAKRLKQRDGRLVLCNLQPHVNEIFEISGFLSIMTMVPTCEAALASAA